MGTANARLAPTGRQLCTLVSMLGLMAFGPLAAQANAVFDAPDATYKGEINAQGPRGAAITAGTEVQLQGHDFKPGQQITLMRGNTVLNPNAPYVADDKGTFKANLKVPEDAAVGLQPILVAVSNPSAAAVFPLKVSPVVPLAGTEAYKQVSAKLAPGLYQSAVSAKNGAVFVTSAVGRPPVKASQLLKLNPDTLAIEAKVTPAVVPGSDDGSVFAVYGVGVDDQNGNVWVTNTRQNSVAVYRQKDLSLVKQFKPGTVAHARDVVIDPALGRAFASASGSPVVAMFNTKTLAEPAAITIKSGNWGSQFSVASLHLDAQAHKLYAVSLSSEEAAVIDAKTGTVEKVIPVEGIKMAMGVAFDAKTNRLFVAAQGSDNLAIVDLASGKTLQRVSTGAGPLNVTFDPVKRLAYVSNRASGTVTVVDPDGKIVANLAGGTFPNHVVADGKGNVFAVNKAMGPDDEQGDRITRFTPVN
ncbi:ATP-binding protein [Pseudomonas sp. RIT-PI-S]|uniref:YncE family protein n=1 Tax=Pseudomonas sp. RIT-PI-S TaxID=3035295 RepID=UPI0021DB4D08|nr:ATP-binding protein [Pseudomonas sp. RIT-PI-S]